eukprot:TCALIF_07542-PA protein Name:"Protein of unknown function" AED:0.00 eAED:0.00 QI:117/1/0.66/1/0/0/3/0/70
MPRIRGACPLECCFGIDDHLQHWHFGVDLAPADHGWISTVHKETTDETPVLRVSKFGDSLKPHKSQNIGT